MKIWKKSLGILLIFMLVMSMVACGNNQENQNNQNNEGQNSETTPETNNNQNNGQNTTQGGTHLTAFKEAFNRCDIIQQQIGNINSNQKRSDH